MNVLNTSSLSKKEGNLAGPVLAEQCSYYSNIEKIVPKKSCTQLLFNDSVYLKMVEGSAYENKTIHLYGVMLNYTLRSMLNKVGEYHV